MVHFDKRLRLGFPGARITSDATGGLSGTGRGVALDRGGTKLSARDPGWHECTA